MASFENFKPNIHLQTNERVSVGLYERYITRELKDFQDLLASLKPYYLDSFEEPSENPVEAFMSNQTENKDASDSDSENNVDLPGLDSGNDGADDESDSDSGNELDGDNENNEADDSPAQTLGMMKVKTLIAQGVRDVIGDKAKDKESNIVDFVAAISDATLDRMHYLHAALTETLRLYPAVPVDGRCVNRNDILPDGFKVKKGDGVYYMAYATGRILIFREKMSKIFDLKDGSRMEIEPESPFKFVAFHAGPRICLGKEFGDRQMKILSIALLCFFRFKLADDTKPVNYRTMFTLHIDGNLTLCAVLRTAA